MTVPTPLAAFVASRRALRPAVSAVQAQGWRPRLAGVLHGEIFSSGGEGSGAAAALAFALDRIASAMPDPAAEAVRDWPDQRRWLWVQDAAACRLTGRPYQPGLPAELRHRLVHVAAKTPEDALFALEEGLRCRDFAFVLGEIAGNPRALSFTAQRRLSLAAEKHGVPLWLVRLDAARDLSSARQRWQVRAAASTPPRWNAQAPGTPAWHAELFRARGHPPGEWVLEGAWGGLGVRPATGPVRAEAGHLVSSPRSA
jgi:protein ImuA